MKLILTRKQMKMLLYKVGVPKGKVISTTAEVLNKILIQKNISKKQHNNYL